MAESIVFNLKIDGATSIKTVSDLKSKVDELKKELETSDIGSEQFNKLSKAVQKGESELANFNKSIEGVDTIKLADSYTKLFNGIVGGFTGLEASLQLFGNENEELTEALVKANQLLVISNSAKAISEGVVEGAVAGRQIVEKASIATTYASIVAQTAWNAIVGTSTGLLKLLRIAIAGTGIGAIALGIIALVQNWDKLNTVVKNNVELFKKIGLVLSVIMPPIGLLIGAIGKLGNAWDWVKTKADGLLVTLGILDTQLERSAQSQINSFKKTEKARERQIELMTLEGKTAKEIRDAQIQLEREKYINYKNLADARIKAGKELTEEEKSQLEELAFNLKKAKLEDAKLTKEENEAKLKEIQEQNKKEHEELVKKLDKNKQIEEEKKQKVLELKRAIEDENIKQIADEGQREIAQLKANFKRRIEDIKGNSDLEKELRNELLATQKIELKALEDKIAKENEDKEKEKRLKEKETLYAANINILEAQKVLLEANNQETFDLQEQLATQNFEKEKATKQLSASELQLLEANYSADMLKIKKARADKEKQIEKDVRDAKVQFAESAFKGISQIALLSAKNSKQAQEFQKAITIAQVSIDTAKSISATIAGASAAASAGGPAAPFLVGTYIASGIATVTSAFMQVKQALKGANTDVAIPNASSVSASAGISNDSSLTKAPVIRATQDSTALVDNQSENKTLTINQPVVKAVVVESDITSTQQRIKRYEDEATFK